MPLVGQHEEPGIRNPLGENLRRHAVIDLTGHIFIALADEDERRLFDILQPLARIVALPRQQVAQVELDWAKVVHSHFQVVLDLLRMSFDVLLGPSYQNRMVPFVLLIAPFDHFFANL